MNEIEKILEEYEAHLQRKAANYERGLWIFRQTPSDKPYVEAIQKLIDDAVSHTKAEMAVRFLESQEVFCTCRCRLHTMPACPKCLSVERCALHSEPDPKTLQKG